MNRALVELTLRYGEYGQHSKTVAVPISEDLTRELLGRVELSDEPLSVLLASPGAFGGKGNAIAYRRRTFEMRRAVAEDICKAMVPELLKVFGVNDELNGYRVEDMSAGERAWHTGRGRLR